MKLLVLCERVDDEGGTESYLRSLLPALAASGDDVRVLARSARRPDAYGVPAEAIAWSDEHDPPSAAAASAVSQAARAFGPDTVAIHNVLDAAVLHAASLSGARVAFHVHDHRPFCPNGDRLYPQGGGICGIPMSVAGCGFHSLVHGCAYGPRPRTVGLVRSRERVANCVRSFGATIVFSQYVANLARRNGVDAARVRLLRPPLADAAYASQLAPRPDRDAVLFAGRVMPSKGARSLVRAVACLPGASRPLVRIAGEGPDLAPALDEARARGVAVEALGRLSDDALRDAYDAASIVAMPSTWGEPFGLVGIEAFARGRPAVAYDSGGIGEWLTPECGALVPRGDETAFAEAILATLQPVRWEAASAAAFVTATHYRLGDHVERLRAIYEGAA
ncbi:MAG: glycosyltransferase family 4 protein [Candidatus Eremiobacteraeota bacterium]|nr:glycosyltransferase family 4 protein [Candidatus Eremiobacteraeota bacterium]